MNTTQALDKLKKDLKESVDQKKPVDDILSDCSKLLKQFDTSWSTQFLISFN